jgi:hypothetical protein
MVERGDADVAQDLDPDLVAHITPGGKIKLIEGLAMNLVYLAIQNNPDVARELSDKKVRQAISYANRLRRHHHRGSCVAPETARPPCCQSVCSAWTRR